MTLQYTVICLTISLRLFADGGMKGTSIKIIKHNPEILHIIEEHSLW